MGEEGQECREQCHAPLDPGRGRELWGASPSSWDPSGQALLQLEAGVAGARQAVHPRCSWKREKEKGGIQLPLHGKAGRLLPRGIHPALAAGEEQGHTGSLEEQLHQHDRRLQHVPAPAFPPAFPLALGPAPPPPAEPGTMRDWRGARAGGGRQRHLPTPPNPHRGPGFTPRLSRSAGTGGGIPAIPTLAARRGTGSPLGLGSSGKGVPPSLLSHIWQRAGMASPHPSSSSSFSWRRWAAFPALHGDPRGGERGQGWWDASRRERDAAGHPVPVTPRFPPAPCPHPRAGNEAKVRGR